MIFILFYKVLIQFKYHHVNMHELNIYIVYDFIFIHAVAALCEVVFIFACVFKMNIYRGLVHTYM